jgi:hypothetical protein
VIASTIVDGIPVTLLVSIRQFDQSITGEKAITLMVSANMHDSRQDSAMLLLEHMENWLGALRAMVFGFQSLFPRPSRICSK